jgi:DnaK suppressor protein
VTLRSFEVSSREFDHFENISQALARLDEGTYGSCAFCGCRIEEDVLTRTPWANQCLDCQGQDSQP